eukprot:CAMPEP_0171188020 /NCGR_PEP_ID=MMETSP0790-20130122/17617_1 /TAXON_ID=2925 /ORGANISM="Alexandrium catenella, Strain OF101" /LENGTH=375 /DNA_ID=CAMNT_0011653091 /DNA_START=44 /DNA_END=1171 /DNA_ORIENTATION=-
MGRAFVQVVVVGALLAGQGCSLLVTGPEPQAPDAEQHAPPEQQASLERRGPPYSLDEHCDMCEAVPTAGCRTLKCSCPACPSPGEDTISGCSDAIEACSPFIKRIKSVSVFETNSRYRMSDLLSHHGKRWRVDSFAIMCDPKFRNTLLRDVLRETSNLGGADGVGPDASLANLSDGELEQLVGRNYEGPPGYSCVVGETGAGRLQFGTSEEQIAVLARLIASRYQRGLCERAEPSDVVVYVRLGDARRHEDAIVDAVWGMVNSTKGIKRIVFSGVAHYPGYGPWVVNDRSVAGSVELMYKLTARFKLRGFDTAMRSEPSADKDMCYMATARHLALGGSNFGTLVGKVRGQVLGTTMTMEDVAATRTWVDPVLDLL